MDTPNDKITDKAAEEKKPEEVLEGISLSDGTGVYSEVREGYLDKVSDTAEDRKDIKKAKDRILSKKDKIQIRLLAGLNITVFVFLGIYLMLNGSANEYDSIKEEARFEGDSSIYLSSEAFAAGLTPNFAGAQLPEGISEDFIPLYSENNDTAGWIRIPGTNIDHVILQGDTNETYSRYNFYHEYFVPGSIFMDYRNKVQKRRSSLSKNTIVYGHYMAKQKTMFTALENYKKLDYYKEHPVIEMNTIYNNYKWKVIGAFIAAVDSEYDGGNLFYYWYDNFADSNTLAYANEVAFRSYFINPGVDILPEDKFLTLSTCTHLLDIEGVVNARMVVVARLIRNGESEEVNVDAAYENTNRRMPQLWYDQNGKENPYKQYAVWDPFAR